MHIQYHMYNSSTRVAGDYGKLSIDGYNRSNRSRAAAAAAAKQQQQQQHVVNSKRTAVEQAICPPSRTKKLRQLADIQRPNINYEANGSAAAAATGVATHQAPAMRPFGPL